MEKNEPIRKRIVINLDSAQPPYGGQGMPLRANANRPRRWPKVLAFIGAFVVVMVILAAVGAFFWWRYYQTTPAYSVALIIDAAQNDQMEEFDKRINDEEIAKRMVANVSQKVTARYGVAITPSIQKEINNLMPRLMPKVKQTIHEETAKEIKEFATKSKPKPFIIVALAVPSFVTINTQGDTAKASSQLNERTIELGMQRDSDRWKVVEVNDDVLVQRIVDNLMKELPTIGRDTVTDLIKGTLVKKPRKRSSR
jgi:hypothetical protein